MVAALVEVTEVRLSPEHLQQPAEVNILILLVILEQLEGFGEFVSPPLE